MELDFLNKKMSLEEVRMLNPLVLAFIGDAVFEIIVRTHLVSQNTELSVHKLHVKAISYVKAHSQSEFMKSLMPLLTEDELAIFKRGRNTKSATVPKNADLQEYRVATGFEALIGFLYLVDKKSRISELLEYIIPSINS